MWPFQKKSEQARIFDALDYGLGGTIGGFRVSPAQALGVAAVFAAIRVISEDVAKLPAKLKVRTDNGDTTANGEPEHAMLSSVGAPVLEDSDGYTAMEWIEAIVASAAFHGVGVAYLNRVAGSAREITPIPAENWRKERGIWSIKFSNEAGFTRVDRQDLFILKGPQLGLNITTQTRQAIGLAIAIDKLMNSLARKSGRPNGIISTGSLDSADKAATLISRLKTYFGPNSEGGLMPLDMADLKFHRISLTPDELQIKDTKSGIVQEIASAFRVQPARLMHDMSSQSYASAYQWNIAHVTDCIQPWVKRFCQSFDKDVLRDRVAKGFYCDIDLKGLLRGSPQERAEFLLKLRTMAVLSPMGVAQLEDLPTEGLSINPAHPLLTNPNPSAAQKDANHNA